MKEIGDFVPPPRGKSEVQDFDLLAHIEKVKEKEEGEEEVEYDGEDDKSEEAVEIYSKTAPNIQKFWIKLLPGQDAFSSVVIKTFQDGLGDIRCFERWSKHSDLEDYANALEEWDQAVGDNWEEPEQTTLDPQTWIVDHPTQRTHEDTIKMLIRSAYEKAETFLTRFQPLLEIYWRNKQFDTAILVDENTKNPVDVLQNVLRILRYYQNHFAANLPQCTDIGLI